MSIGIYPRKLLFFSVIALAVFGSVKLYETRASLFPSVSASLQDNVNTANSSESYLLEMTLNKDGSITIGDQRIAEAIKPLSNLDELRYVVLNQPVTSYQDATVIVHLPKNINRLVEDPKIIAVHGATPGTATLEDKEITYTAQNIGSMATVTVVAQFPKGYFDLPAAKKIAGFINNDIPGLVWVIGGTLLPLIAAIIVLQMTFKSSFQLQRKVVEGERTTLPANLSPAVVSAITDGRVSARTIISTLVDLARRNYIELYNRGDDFVIYLNPLSRQAAASLKQYEIVLLNKIFLPRQKQVGAMDVEARIARHLFSRKIALFYMEVYNEAVSLGYFEKSPAVLHLRYRLIGIGTFFAGLFGYLLFALYAPDPKFVLFFWLSLILFGVWIVNLAPRLTQFTLRGDQLRSQWLQFRNFLTKDEPMGVQSQLFEKYLPYALAMDCEAEWSARFSNSSFVEPQWYGWAGSIPGIENFTKSLNAVVDYVGENLNKANEPLVR